MTERLPTPHPGDLLRDDVLKPWRKSATWLAKQLGVPPIAISEILRRKRAVSPAMALRLSQFLGTSPDLWLGMQTAYDLEEARRDERLGAELARIERVDPNMPVYLDEEEPSGEAQAAA